jgi:hypothetical protein
MMYHVRASGAFFDGSEDHMERWCQKQTEEGHTQHPEERERPVDPTLLRAEGAAHDGG